MDLHVDKRLWGMAWKFTRWLGDIVLSAEDFYQEAAIVRYRKFERKGKECPAPLIISAARSAMIDLIRRDGSTILYRYSHPAGKKQKRMPERVHIVSMEGLTESERPCLSMPDPNALLNTEDRLLWAASKASMWGLEILRLRTRGLTQKEIAEQLHFTEPNICIILKKMKTLYDQGER